MQRLHRRRLSATQRVLRELTWPSPGGVLLVLIGASAIILGAAGMGGRDLPELTATPASSSSATSATSAPPTIEGTPPKASAPAPTAPTTTPAPDLSLPVAGAAASSPIQSLFARATAPALEPALRNIANPSSPLVMVNKHTPLQPAEFQPQDLVTPNVATSSGEKTLLRQEAATAAEQMFSAAAGQGVGMVIRSSFRGYTDQLSLYDSYVSQHGVAEADTFSARPGYSEHQTGFALDLGDSSVAIACEFTPCFAQSPAAKWAAAHAHDYGFIVRYPLGTQDITGYSAESWHLRYVGVAVAQDMTTRGFSTYEEYLGVPPAPAYQ